MDDHLSDLQPIQPDVAGAMDPAPDEIEKIRSSFEARLVVAGLRSEAIHAGMVDLDGLKFIDLSTIRMDDDDKVVDGRKVMEELRRKKPWLFSNRSSSNTISAPASKPVRQKTALEMTDEEYAAARSALVRNTF